jgi:hypothetical protein
MSSKLSFGKQDENQGVVGRPSVHGFNGKVS